MIAGDMGIAQPSTKAPGRHTTNKRILNSAL